MAKTQAQYADEIYKSSVAQAEAQKKAREQSDAQTLAQINRAIDDAAGTTINTYQQNIDTAPQQFQEYYDANAIDEAFAREQIKNSMAEAGMSTSGQNLSMQTALSLQRNRQDAAVDTEQRDYVKEMQNAIDAVKANAAAQKQEQEIEMTAARNTWWDNILSSIRDSSQTAAAEMYAADQEAAAKQAQAVIDASSEIAERREAYALHMMKNMDYTEDQAWAAAYAQYPSGDATTDSYYAIYNNAIKQGYSPEEASVIAQSGENAEETTAKIKAQNYMGDKNILAGSAGGWDDLQIGLRSAGKGMEGLVANTIIEIDKELKRDGAYTKASSAEKKYMRAYAIANTLRAKYVNNKQLPMSPMVLVEYLPLTISEEEVDIISEALGLEV